ncbi:hypothetical protein [Burkholderia ubonensis]|uniref:hypothetical protein n=1 Tax=Burkholderia ubonensis TaxID=101571 RepID=UPI000B12C280|nr:hypothetical protein [Burkholderia ubonensis]
MVIESREHAIGAFEMWEDLATDLNAFGRTIYEADRARLQALISGNDAPAA